MNAHKHEVSYRFTINSHAGIDLGTCECRVPILTYNIAGRRITIERATDKTVDLFERACSLGFTEESAAALADCWDNFVGWSDPCMIHPNHSVSQDHQGYAVDDCRACEIMILTHDNGWSMEAWLAAKAQREQENAAAHQRWLADMAAEPTEWVAGVSGEPEPLVSVPVERDIAAEIFAAERAAILASDNDDFPSASELPAVPTLSTTPKPVKIKVMHGGADGVAASGCCGRIVSHERMTNDPEKVTCQRCLGTRRFQNWVARLRRERLAADFRRAGLSVGLAVRHISSGHMGVVTSASMGSIVVGYWAGSVGRSVYQSVAEFDSACEILVPCDLYPVGTRLVSSEGVEGGLTEVSRETVGVAWDDGGRDVHTFSAFMSQVCQGRIAPVPAPSTAVYVMISGQRVEVGTSDVAEVGMVVAFGYGYHNNGVVSSVNPYGVVVRRADGTCYPWRLANMVQALNTGEVSTFMSR